MLLNEIDSNEILDTQEKVLEWIYQYCGTNVRKVNFVNGTLDVDIEGSIYLHHSAWIKQFPVTFRYVSENFNCSENGLETLKGCPIKVGESFAAYSNKLTSFDFLPKSMEICVLNNNVCKSLHGIEKHTITDCIAFDRDFTHILGLVHVKGLHRVRISGSEVLDEITNKHLQGDKDIFAFQEELIEAGYIEQAKL